MTISRTFEADFADWVARRKAEQQARRAARALRMLRLRVLEPLPLARVWMRGPKWKRAFNVTHRALVDVDPEAARDRRPLQAKTYWWYDFEHDVRELVVEEIRPGVLAEWSDPFEQFGIRRRDLEAL